MFVHGVHDKDYRQCAGTSLCDGIHRCQLVFVVARHDFAEFLFRGGFQQEVEGLFAYGVKEVFVVRCVKDYFHFRLDFIAD